MTKQEFIERVNVNVTDEEYEHIDCVYMASDVDKDVFCKMWVKMNKNRVELAKTIAKKREIFMQDFMFVYDICNRNYRLKSANPKAEDVFTKKELTRLENLGIEWHSYAFEVFGGAHQLLDKMIEELRKAA